MHLVALLAVHFRVLGCAVPTVEGVAKKPVEVIAGGGQELFGGVVALQEPPLCLNPVLVWPQAFAGEVQGQPDSGGGVVALQ